MNKNNKHKSWNPHNSDNSTISAFLIIIVLYISPILLIAQDWKGEMKSADNLIMQKNYSAAMNSANSAMKIAEQEFGRKSPYFAQSLNKLAEIYFVQSNFIKAVELYTESIELQRSYDGKNESPYLSALNNLSVALQYLGKLTQAEEYLNESIDLKRQLGMSKDMSFAIGLNNLAKLKIEVGDYNNAESLLNESLAIKKTLEGDNTLSYATTQLNLGVLHKNLGQYDKAAEILEEAYNKFLNNTGKDGAETRKTLLQLALVYDQSGNKNKAVAILETLSKSASLETNMTNPTERAGLLMNLALLKWNADQRIESEELLINAKDIIANSAGNGHPLYASCLNSLGVINWYNEKYEDSKKYFQEAISLRKQVLGHQHPEYATSIHNYAGLLKDMGNYDEAEKYYQEAFQNYFEQIDFYFDFMTESERNNFYSNLKERFELFNCYVLTRYKENPQIVGEMYNYQLRTKGLLLNSVKKSRQQILNTSNEMIKRKFKSWLDLKDDIAKYYLLSKAELKHKSIDLDQLRARATEIEKELIKESAAFKQMNIKKSYDWRDIAAKLKSDEAAIEIVRFRFFEKKWSDNIFYAALIIDGKTKSVPEFVVFENGREMEELYINNYIKSVQIKIKDNESYKYFWEKIDSKLQNKKVVYFSPDGVYNKININSLLKPDGSYILENYNVRVMTNTNDLLHSNAINKMKLKNAALFGYPDFKLTLTNINPSIIPIGITNRERSNVNSPKIEELPETKNEVIKISGMLAEKGISNRVYSEKDASENNLKMLEKPEILHIATHGYFLKDFDLKHRNKAFGINIESVAQNPLLRSGLLLTGAEDALVNHGQYSGDYENGILYAFEAMNLSLEGTKLVVLSACETGVGEIKNGEGVYGLQRAFRIAGAENIIMSLWKVDDKASSELMTNFYSKFLSGINIHEAFYKTQLEMMHSYRHPYYWAGFVLIGN